MQSPAVPSLILASGSAIRAKMLRDAGINFAAEVARVDEASVKMAMIADAAPPRDIADALAELKARRVSGRRPGHLVLGSDQILVLDGQIFDKPADLSEARRQLCQLRAKTHELLSAAVIFEDGRPVWRHIGKARLTMRPFSEAFLETYLAAEGDGLLATVGCYKLEESGSQLFTRVEGDYFSVLGLPLLEVLGYLRTRGVSPE